LVLVHGFPLGCGHKVMLEARELVAIAISDLLKRI
jgi:hypothetical protein